MLKNQYISILNEFIMPLNEILFCLKYQLIAKILFLDICQ
jgi:hypothetical protein